MRKIKKYKLSETAWLLIEEICEQNQQSPRKTLNMLREI